MPAAGAFRLAESVTGLGDGLGLGFGDVDGFGVGFGDGLGDVDGLLVVIFGGVVRGGVVRGAVVRGVVAAGMDAAVLLTEVGGFTGADEEAAGTEPSVGTTTAGLVDLLADDDGLPAGFAPIRPGPWPVSASAGTSTQAARITPPITGGRR